MEKVQQKYIIKDGSIMPSVAGLEFTENAGVCIFEVIRIISGVPLFINEHLQRLQQSADKSNQNVRLNQKRLQIDVRQLIESNRVNSGNLKIVIVFSGKKSNTWLYFIPYFYPSEEKYLEGVTAGILHTERSNPEAKTIQPNVRETANRLIRSENVYEVLLVDRNGFVREGSRSNVFFIRGKKVVTPPTEQVLNGITRSKVIEILKSGCCAFEESSVLFDRLQYYDGIFITGTSPKVLSVKRVANMEFNPQHPVYIDVLKRYNQMISEYISSHI